MNGPFKGLPVELPKAYRLMNHGPVTLIGSCHGRRRNVMAASWTMPVDFDPPKVSVVIDKSTLTRELVDASGFFSLSIPLKPLAASVERVGTDSGRDGDKFAAEGLEAFPGIAGPAPLVGGCAAWLECRVIKETAIERTYDLFIAEVIGAFADPECFADGRWKAAAGRDPTLHYIAGGAFFETGGDFSVL